MTHQEKVILIYSKIADKTLSEGCDVLTKNRKSGKLFTLYSEDRYYKYINEDSAYFEYCGEKSTGCDEEKYDVIRIIQHPIHFGYAIDWLEKNNHFRDWQDLPQFCDLWKDKTLPIEAEVNEEALDYMIRIVK